MAVTFGLPTAPSQVTTNLDALFATSLANYRRRLIDNVGRSLPLLDKIIRNGNYQSTAGGTYIAEPLMYDLGSFDWYDSYDTLSTDPTDGITQSVWEWRQAAAPIVYSMKEVKQNKQKLVDLVKAKIQQAEMGIRQGFNRALWQGAGSGALTTIPTSSINGASGVNPLPYLIQYDPSVSMEVGNINQATATNQFGDFWWRNKTKNSTATTYTAFLMEMANMYNNCSNGTGGEPDIIITDQTTYELFQAAMYDKWHKIDNDKNFDWENTKFKNALVTYDEMVPNALAGTLDTTAADGGTAYFINSKFFKMRYEEDTNFVMSPFQKPVDQDARIAHILWMGNLTISNRRKHGVIGGIARTMTTS